jgi:predicted ATP-dependent endonuclease of OLD family
MKARNCRDDAHLIIQSMKLTHVGIRNFRSIGEDFATIDVTKKINVLVGANNFGKSKGRWLA